MSRILSARAPPPSERLGARTMWDRGVREGAIGDAGGISFSCTCGSAAIANAIELALLETGL